jgi:DNA-directed RNA polymerase subunit H (RpoH/RPB5)
MNDMKEIVDKIIRSRPIVLDVLETRGFDAKAFRDELPTDLIAKAGTPLVNDVELELLRIQVASKVEGEKAYVLYWMGVVRHKLNDSEKFEKLLPEGIEPQDTIIVLLNEPFHETFHKMVLRRWVDKKQRVSFFDIRQLMFNPLDHIMVPLHRKVPSEEVEPLLKKLLVKSKIELPHIKYHMDIPARVLGILPGEIVEITRPSPTIGEYKVYRICTP